MNIKNIYIWDKKISPDYLLTIPMLLPRKETPTLEFTSSVQFFRDARIWFVLVLEKANLLYPLSKLTCIYFVCTSPFIYRILFPAIDKLIMMWLEKKKGKVAVASPSSSGMLLI